MAKLSFFDQLLFICAQSFALFLFSISVLVLHITRLTFNYVRHCIMSR